MSQISDFDPPRRFRVPVRTEDRRSNNCKIKFRTPDGPHCPGLLDGSVVGWQNAALRLGEALAPAAPLDYYDMTPDEWLKWALSAVAER